MANSGNPWNDFWSASAQRGTSAGTAAGEASGCLPARWAGIEDSQKAVWRSFASDLPENAKVLDLATGNGMVLRWMEEARPDLTLSGIDLAPTIPPAPAGTTTQGGVAMESLPFADGSFNAVTSQFGFEYGDVKKVAAEIARVLVQGGKVGLIVHRGDGAILEHNQKRQRELMWALKEKSVGKKVSAALKGGPLQIDKAARIAQKVAEAGSAKFGQSSPAWEIPEAIRRSCLLGRRSGVGSIIETIGMIEGQAKNELGRIRSLAGACKTADNREKLVGAFEANGLSLVSTEALTEPSGRKLADFILFQ